ncbi:trafficking protein particle complex II-specific subunit 120 [Salvia divinorum]|uniref:Trafficking protein particle complex II-specific subunit 120 n=1 Tax=Salvia divinorum TaxID=28513 RepID=A0ABD1HTT2_SALDI
MVESIYLSVHSGNLDAFPVSVSLPPNSSKVITLSGIPTKEGLVSIPGCIVHCFGVITEHFVKEVDSLLIGATQGLMLSDPFRNCGAAKLKNVLLPSITVVPPLPLLVSHISGGDGSVMLYKGMPGSSARQAKDRSSPLLLIHYAGPLTNPGEPETVCAPPPGRRLVIPLNICVLQGLYFVKARLLSMEIPARTGEACSRQAQLVRDDTEQVNSSERQADRLMKIDPYRGSWGLRLLELKLYDPTDVLRRTRYQGCSTGCPPGICYGFATLLLPDPLTFGFRLAKTSSDDINSPGKVDSEVKTCGSGDSIIAHEMTAMEVLVRNNTKEAIRMNLSIVCKDVAGENCMEGDKATVF